MDKQQAKHILKNTGYIGIEVGIAFDVAIKSMNKLEKIEQIIDDYNNGDEMEYKYLDRIREALEKE